jgi:hypothetical protein
MKVKGLSIFFSAGSERVVACVATFAALIALGAGAS